MKTYIFDDEITQESVSDFLDVVDEGVEIVYMRTPGGEIDFIDVLCLEMYRRGIILIGFGHLMSAGVTTFTNYRGTKSLIPGVEFGIHLPTFDLDVRESRNPVTFGVYKSIYTLRAANYEAQCAAELENIKKLGLSEEYIASINNGDTIYLSWDVVSGLVLGESYTPYLELLSAEQEKPNEEAINGGL